MSTQETVEMTVLDHEMQQRVEAARQARSILTTRGLGGVFAPPTQQVDALDIVNLASWIIDGKDPWAQVHGCASLPLDTSPTSEDDALDEVDNPRAAYGEWFQTNSELMAAFDNLMRSWSRLIAEAPTATEPKSPEPFPWMGPIPTSTSIPTYSPASDSSRPDWADGIKRDESWYVQADRAEEGE